MLHFGKLNTGVLGILQTTTQADCIYTALLSKALYNLPLILPLILTIGFNDHARHWPKHRESFKVQCLAWGRTTKPSNYQMTPNLLYNTFSEAASYSGFKKKNYTLYSNDTYPSLFKCNTSCLFLKNNNVLSKSNEKLNYYLNLPDTVSIHPVLDIKACLHKKTKSKNLSLKCINIT